MENGYWIDRKRSAMVMARAATTAKVRLIHYDLAGRYSIMAAQYPASLAKDSRRAKGGERPVLHLSRPNPPSSELLAPRSDGEGS